MKVIASHNTKHPWNALKPMCDTREARALYLIEVLKRISPAEEAAARAAANVKDTKTKKRLIECLTSHHALTSPAKRGPASKFTAEVLHAARDAVADPGCGLYTGRSLTEKLIHDGLLHPPVDTDNFMRHFEAFLKARGETLDPTFTGTVFAIRGVNKEKRVQWCKEVQQLLQEVPLENWIFEDETEVEQEPHPKGMWCKQPQNVLKPRLLSMHYATIPTYYSNSTR